MKKMTGKTDKTRLLQGIITAGLRVFETAAVKAVAESLDIQPSYVLSLVSNLIQDGWLQPIKKGVYQLSYTTGVSPIHEFEIAMHLVRPAMISYYSAFYHHGLTEQVPKMVYISTIKETATPQRGEVGKRAGFKFNGVHYRIIQLKKEKLFGEVKAWRGESAFLIADLERTLIEGFASPQYCGGFGEVMYGLEESTQKIDLDKLIHYARQWDVAVARRLGWALAEIGIENEKTLSLIQPEYPGYRLLDPSRPAQGAYSKQWRLRINL